MEAIEETTFVCKEAFYKMTAGWRSWKVKTVGCLVVGSVIASSTRSALAQITPDNTLGAENSTVTSTEEVDSINGGAIRGANLFHSFGEFNINAGRTAVFTNPLGVENILTRVTGANPSNILGTLGVAGNANLFLMNPNGIIFGQNARLDINGSFVGTTANTIEFGERGFFSATNPETSSPLLTVNPSALIFNQIRTASIQNNSVAPSGLDPSSESIAKGLRVTDGKSLLLVGGDINMDGGGLYAFGGRVELGGLTGAGTVGLNGNDNNLSLNFSNNVEKSNVSLSDSAVVDVGAGDGGSIAVNAVNFKMTGRSILATGIRSGLGFNNSEAGDIDINTTGTINLNESSIFNQVQPEASGQGGNVNVSANTLKLEGGAQINVNTYSSGRGGTLSVDAFDVQLVGTRANGQPSGFFVSTSGSTGDAGDVLIKTNNLLVKDGAVVDTTTTGSGKGGNLSVDASDVQLVGESSNGQPSGFFVSTLDSTGDAGDVSIKTNNLLIKDEAALISASFGAGKAGNLKVDAQDVQLIGGDISASSFQENSTGDAGDLTIKTNTLLVKDRAEVSTVTFGAGKAGNLKVDVIGWKFTGI